jgi:hypothetical protein
MLQLGLILTDHPLHARELVGRHLRARVAPVRKSAFCAVKMGSYGLEERESAAFAAPSYGSEQRMSGMFTVPSCGLEERVSVMFSLPS